MRALEAEVVDAIWAAVEPLLPPADRSHPLGYHRPRIILRYVQSANSAQEKCRACSARHSSSRRYVGQHHLEEPRELLGADLYAVTILRAS